jgi:uncharacterized protein YraI
MTARTKVDLNLRRGPGTTSPVIRVLPKGTGVDVREKRRTWWKVRALGQLGWVSRSYLAVEAERVVGTGKTTVNLNLRSGQGTGSQVITVLPVDTEVEILGESGLWLKVRADGHRGWVHGRYVKKTPEPAPEAAPAPEPLESRFGRTTSALRLRKGAGTSQAVITTLPSGTRVEIVDRRGDWLEVKAVGKKGWVHGGYVRMDHEETEDGFLKDWLDVSDIPLEPARRVGGGTSVARAWNKFGGLLTELSEKLGIEPETAAAVLAVESSGKGFENGRIIIRFENHIFHRRWAGGRTGRFSDHFRYDSGQRWKGHKWRPTAGGAWRTFHGRQSREWEVFDFASGLSRSAARESISMGLPQIMGFNHAAIGYESASRMFDAFARGEAQQVLGFFDFVRGANGNSTGLLALQRRDFELFARYYNGAGQVAKYGAWMREAYDAIKGLL